MASFDELPTAAFFNPQANPVTAEYLSDLRTYLTNNQRLCPLVETIRLLPQTWQIFARHREDIASLAQGPKYTEALAEWIDGGDAASIVNAMSGCCALPLLTIVQICQYFQFLDLKRTTHLELMGALSIGGVHGYCGGLLPAVAVALSGDEWELAQNASRILRIAVGIGAYGDLGDETMEGGFSNMVIRLKNPGQGEEIVRLHPGTYISAITDPKTISVVGPASKLEQIQAFAGAHGLRSQRVHISGKVHNPENKQLATDLEELCSTHDSFRLPSTSKLKVPFRSNLNGEVVKQSLTREILQTILTSRCDWYQLLGYVATDLSSNNHTSHNLINFGTGDCLSLPGNLEHFDINTTTPRYIDIVTGHAVLGRPLCPAGLYMECVAMATQLLLDDQEPPGGLILENCTFKHPLGINRNRAVALKLQNRSTKAAWSFEVSSRPRDQKRTEWSLHSKGHVSYRVDMQLQHYQRLVSRRVQEIQNSTDLESLRQSKAYMVFSRVVDYSGIFKGISSIKFADTEALGHVNVPLRPSTSETKTLKSCDTISLDIFVQVCGLLINSHHICPKDDAYLAVGADSIQITETCALEKCREWNVYTVFEPVARSKARGDVFVMRQSGELVIAMIGIHFSKVPFKTLERLLTAAGNVSCREVAKNMTTQSIPEPPSSPKPTEELTETTSIYEDKTSPRFNGVSAKYQRMEDLRTILASYAGLPSHEVMNQTSLATLGIDSLASIELADELSSKFGRPVGSSMLMDADFLTLCRQLDITKTSSTAEKATVTSKISKARRPELQLSPPKKPKELGLRSKLMEVLSQHLGCPMSAITDDARLEEMGIDSLATIELKADIEASFQVNLNDHDFAPSSTIEEILRLLSLSVNVTEDSGLTDALSSNTSLSSMVLTPNSPEMLRISDTTETSPLEVDPVKILTVCSSMFASSAKDNGFTGHWDVIAPKYNKLVLAYVVEAFAYLGSDVRRIQTNGSFPLVDFHPRHSQVMHCLWDILERQGIVYYENGTVLRTSKRITEVRSAQLTRGYIGWHPKYAVDFALMGLTGPVLADCLTGVADPLKILFGNPKAQQVLDDFYHESPMLATMTDHLVNFIKQIIAQSRADVDIRIIEIGGGFGGTTTRLAQILQQSDCHVEYTFTDIAPTLVDKAKKKFCEYSWMDFGTVNLDQDPPTKYHGRYDIVIATNVVHATKDLVASTTRMKSLLKDGGFICLSQITKVIVWHNIVFGLLPGWWSFTDGRSYALQSAEEWMAVFRKAGFESTGYSTGPSEEARTQQLLIGSTRAQPKERPSSGLSQGDSTISTVVSSGRDKFVDDTEIRADIYFPKEQSSKPMPIALMIHGGGYMTLSRKAIRPLQTSFLLRNGILPVSLDHRLCPDMNIINGPMADIRDAVAWAQSELPAIASEHRINVETSKIAVIGWSTGGHLAMTTAWTTVEAGIEPPTAILNFYGPSDFEALASHHDQGDNSPPIKTPSKDDIDKWLVPSDPRSDLVLSLFQNTSSSNLSLLLPPSHKTTTPTQTHLNAINPFYQLRHRNYHTPTFIIHGSKDEIIPPTHSILFHKTMEEMGLDGGVLIVEGAKHIHDVGVGEGSEEWIKGVGPGYEFMLKYLLG
ncbi:MAG: hypothetical protein Q9192_002045 [Flavoplaca navasiana]